MRKCRFIYYFLFLLFLNGCADNSYPENFEYKLVVEGWIEEGDVPHVILTQNKPLLSVIDTTSMEDMIVRWAKVSVSDGEKTEILSGRIDKNYFPPFIFRGAEMRGEAGKTYMLTVEYSGKTWTAQTYIPESVLLKEIKTVPVADNDTLFSIETTFDDPAGVKNYYKYFTLVKGANRRFMPSLMGNLDDNLFSGESKKMIVSSGLDQMRIEDFQINFTIGDTVSVKFCTMPEFGFRYWTTYENEIINGENLFFPANRNLPTNIEGGGMGIWCGYGAMIYMATYHP